MENLPQPKYTCPCCGYKTIEEGIGMYEICPICFWEDDLAQLRFPTMGWGPNKVSLIDAQINYLKMGASEERLLSFVRKPEAIDVLDSKWRPIDLPTDKVETSCAGQRIRNVLSQRPDNLQLLAQIGSHVVPDVQRIS